ncbi:hypothetical protein [Saccharothrix sp.]|uniref:hypothetical protein n=1 Tax=Saccharothrix sp. TaxID=1873460 RepID=UPI0028120FD7|nr:hypothetical protein [Saccharothrix sp.]
MSDQPRPEDTPDPGTRPLPTPPVEGQATGPADESTGRPAGTAPVAGPPEQAGAEPPHEPGPSAAGSGQAVPPAPPPAHAGFPPPRRETRVGRVARHRATQLVAVGLLGLVLGGGLVALFDHDRGHDRRGAFDRPGHSRMDDRGPGRDFHERERDRER